MNDSYDPRMGDYWLKREPGSIQTNRMFRMYQTLNESLYSNLRYHNGEDLGITPFEEDLELGLHNFGHVRIGNDLSERGKCCLGVMSTTVASMRDTIFYRWHGFIHSQFQLYKDILSEIAPYNEEELTFKGIQVESAKVQPKFGLDNMFYTCRELTEVPVRWYFTADSNSDTVWLVSNIF